MHTKSIKLHHLIDICLTGNVDNVKPITEFHRRFRQKELSQRQLKWLRTKLRSTKSDIKNKIFQILLSNMLAGFNAEQNKQSLDNYICSHMDAREIINLALLYEHGVDGVLERDIVKAIDLYKKAIEQGEIDAMNNLALLYEHGVDDVLERDIVKAIDLYKKAIEQGEIYSDPRNLDHPKPKI